MSAEIRFAPDRYAALLFKNTANKSITNDITLIQIAKFEFRIMIKSFSKDFLSR